MIELWLQRAGAAWFGVAGKLMATNILYPIVPCHRVVGADFSLVGYGGRASGEALGAKLERLRAEARGYREELGIPVGKGLRVFPSERVIEKAEREAAEEGRRLSSPATRIAEKYLAGSSPTISFPLSARRVKRKHQRSLSPA